MNKRKQIRLLEYDYRNSGLYFVTFCIKSGTILSRIVKNKIQLNKAGNIVEKCWFDLPNHYKNCQLDYYCIMPDHFHGIIVIDNELNNVGTGFKPVPTVKSKQHDLSEIIRGFKTYSSRRINDENIFTEKFQWQRSFYDRIIRNEKELFQIRTYINQNPLRKKLDE